MFLQSIESPLKAKVTVGFDNLLLSRILRKLDALPMRKTKAQISNCGADKRICFRYMDSAIPLLLISKISSFYPTSVIV